MSRLVFVLALVLFGCPAPSAVDAGLPQLYARVERVANGLPEASVETAGLLRVLDDGRVVSPVDTGSGVIGALRLRAADGRVTTLTVPPAEDGGQFSFFEDDGNYGGFADAPARGWAVLDGGLHEYVGAGGKPRGRLPDGTVLVEVAGSVRGQTLLVRWRPDGADGGRDVVDAHDAFADLSFVRFARLARNGTLFFAGRGGALGEVGEPVVLRPGADGGFLRDELHPPRFSAVVPGSGLAEPPCCAVADIDAEAGAVLGLQDGHPIIRRGDAVDAVDAELGEVGRLNARGDVLYATQESRMRFEGTTWRFDPSTAWAKLYPELAGRPVLQAVDMNASGQLLLRPTAASAYLVTPSVTEVPIPTEVLEFRFVSGTATVPEPLDLTTAQVGLMLASASLSLNVTAVAASGQRRVLTVLINGAAVQPGAMLSLRSTPGQGPTVSVSYVDRVVGLTAVGSGKGTIEVLSMSPAKVKLVDVELSSSGSLFTVSGPVSEK